MATQNKVVEVEVEVEGLAPGMLMHKFGIETEAALVKSSRGAGKAKVDPKKEAENSAYRLDNGDLYQPAEHIFQVMVKAAAGFQISGRGKKTYKDCVKGLLAVTPEYIPHLTPKGEHVKDYEIDSRAVRIQSARVIRHRPLLREWRLAFHLTTKDTELLPITVIQEILTEAGRMYGIGDYRPRYGTFRVTKFKEI